MNKKKKAGGRGPVETNYLYSWESFPSNWGIDLISAPCSPALLLQLSEREAALFNWGSCGGTVEKCCIEVRKRRKNLKEACPHEADSDAVWIMCTSQHVSCLYAAGALEDVPSEFYWEVAMAYQLVTFELYCCRGGMVTSGPVLILVARLSDLF